MNGQRKTRRALADGMGKLSKEKGKIRVTGEGKRFADTKCCDYKFQGEHRWREIEDIIRITPGYEKKAKV